MLERRRYDSIQVLRDSKQPLESSKKERLVIAAIGVAVGFGCIVRAFHVLSADFPLNDGGLFYVMVQELQRSHYRLPDFTSYNASSIAYAYPPFGLYVAGMLDDITPLTLMDVFRFLPLVVSTLTIIAFYCLASSMLKKDETVVAAVFAFALIPRSFIWLAMGGGITRSFGFLFAILTLYYVHRLYTTSEARYVIGATMCAGLTALSHVGTVPFLAFSILVLLLFYGRHKAALMHSCVVAIGTLIVTAPWWVTVIAMHGVEPFQAAGATGGSVFSESEARRAVIGVLARLGVGSSTGGSTGEPVFPLIGTFAFLGALYSVITRKWALVSWWLAIILLDVRAGATYATVPIAMLAGIGMTRVFYPLLNFRGPVNGIEREPVRVDPVLSLSLKKTGRHLRRHAFKSVVLIFLLCYAALSGVAKHPSFTSDLNYLVALSDVERTAIHLAGAATGPSSRFLVLPESQWSPWQADKTSEWFPALTGRTSVATVQGAEWLPGGRFKEARQNWKSLKNCQSAVSSCLDQWSKTTRIQFTHVYVPQPPSLTEDSGLCCRLLIQSLKTDPRYDIMYDGPGAVVFVRR